MSGFTRVTREQKANSELALPSFPKWGMVHILSWENEFSFNANKMYFHAKDYAPVLALKKRLRPAFWKWPTNLRKGTTSPM